MIKCPKCEKMVSHFKITPVDLKESPGGRDLKGAAYICPLCNTAISVGYNPLQTTDEIANKIAKILRGY